MMLSIRTAPRRSGGDVSFLQSVSRISLRQKSRLLLCSGRCLQSASASFLPRDRDVCPLVRHSIRAQRQSRNQRKPVRQAYRAGRIIAVKGETGFQPDVLRGGIYFGLYRLKYRIHKVPFVAIPQGKIGYVYARDGEALTPAKRSGESSTATTFKIRAFLGGDHSATPPQLGSPRPATLRRASRRRLRDQFGPLHGNCRRPVL